MIWPASGNEMRPSGPTRRVLVCSGAVGVATSLGYYLIAFGVALLAVIVLAALRVLAHNVIRGEDDDADDKAAGKTKP